MQMIETSFEETERLDPIPERAAALHAASMVGIPQRVLRSLKRADCVSGISAREWLRIALDADRASRSRGFGEGLWQRMVEEELG